MPEPAVVRVLVAPPYDGRRNASRPAPIERGAEVSLQAPHLRAEFPPVLQAEAAEGDATPQGENTLGEMARAVDRHRSRMFVMPVQKQAAGEDQPAGAVLEFREDL